MLITRDFNRRNQIESIALASATFLAIAALSLANPLWLMTLPIVVLVYGFWRRKVTRRLKLLRKPWPQHWDSTLIEHVAFFRALNPTQKERFCRMMQVFLDEVVLTGVRTEVDATTRVLVAASAVIPVFAIDDWDYSGLGEVLIYPSAYNERFETVDGNSDRILGMVGDGHLSGIMILSKPDLLAGFANDTDRRNVGIHEFAHLVDKADGSIDGLPATIPREVVRPWIQWVANELRSDGIENQHIDDYAYTNEAEYFAVLSEYFFESPASLEMKNPQLYAMLQKVYRQDPKGFLSARPKRQRRFGRNAPCPCDSGEKFKRCCGARRANHSS